MQKFFFEFLKPLKNTPFMIRSIFFLCLCCHWNALFCLQHSGYFETKTQFLPLNTLITHCRQPLFTSYLKLLINKWTIRLHVLVCVMHLLTKNTYTVAFVTPIFKLDYSAASFDTRKFCAKTFGTKKKCITNYWHRIFKRCWWIVQ